MSPERTKAELGLVPAPVEAKSVEQAMALFMDSKRGEDLSPNTLYKDTHTLKRLQDFCDKAGVFFAKDITLAHLTTWRASWPFRSPLVKRSWQERVKAFFKFCTAAGITPVNPTLQLATIQWTRPDFCQMLPHASRRVCSYCDGPGFL